MEPRASEGLAAFVENWALYRDPVLSAVLAGVALAALGAFVLLRRAVFLTAALSHAAGLGVALAVLVGDRIAQEAHDVTAILFGTAVLVRPIDLALLAGGACLRSSSLPSSVPSPAGSDTCWRFSRSSPWERRKRAWLPASRSWPS